MSRSLKMKRIMEDTIHVLGVMFSYSGADLFHVEKYLHTRGNPLQVAWCSIYPGQAQLTHTWQPTVNEFLWVNKNCTAHKKATIISICLLNS